MPVTICYTHDQILNHNLVQQLAGEWAVHAKVDAKDVHVSVVPLLMQSGQPYKILAQLFLPTLWTHEEVNNIQLNLHRLLMKYGSLAPSEIVIITTLVPSGQIVENGSLVTWSSPTSQKNNSSVL